jgi:hypothetical protein
MYVDEKQRAGSKQVAGILHKFGGECQRLVGQFKPNPISANVRGPQKGLDAFVGITSRIASYQNCLVPSLYLAFFCH